MDLHVATSSGLTSLGSPNDVTVGGAVTCLEPTARGLFAVVDGSSLYRIAEGDARQVADAGDLRLNCLLATSDAFWAGASDARLLTWSEGSLEPVGEFDAAPGRDDWYTPWGGPPDVRTLAAPPSGTLYANVHVGGILRSDDDGASWSPTVDIDSDVHQVIAPDGSRVLAACSWGFGLSTDSGATWDFSTAGLHASYCRAVAIADDTIYLTASAGPHGGRSALYRKRVGEDAFTKCADGLPEWFGDNINTGCLVASREEVAFGTSDGSIFVSADSGETWDQAAEGLAPVRWLAPVD